MNSKRSQSLIKASKNLSVFTKFVFMTGGYLNSSVFKQVNRTIYVCVSACVCLSVFLFLGFAGVRLTSGRTRSAPDIGAPLALFISTPPLVCNCSAHTRRAMKFLHRTDCFFFFFFIIQCGVGKSKEG